MNNAAPNSYIVIVYNTTYLRNHMFMVNDQTYLVESLFFDVEIYYNKVIGLLTGV